MLLPQRMFIRDETGAIDKELSPYSGALFGITVPQTRTWVSNRNNVTCSHPALSTFGSWCVVLLLLLPVQGMIPPN